MRAEHGWVLRRVLERGFRSRVRALDALVLAYRVRSWMEG